MSDPFDGLDLFYVAVVFVTSIFVGGVIGWTAAMLRNAPQ